MIRFSCFKCGAAIVVEDKDAGKRGKCPRCGTTNIVARTAKPAQPPSPALPAPAPLPSLGRFLPANYLLCGLLFLGLAIVLPAFNSAAAAGTFGLANLYFVTGGIARRLDWIGRLLAWRTDQQK